MTRDEFIDRWVAAIKQLSGGIERTDYGALWEGQKFFALPCDCGEEGCKGWAMVPDILVETHNMFGALKGKHHD
jgi:hypothetical protein